MSLYSSRPHLPVSDHEFEISVCASHYTEITLVLQFWNLLNIGSFFYHFCPVFSFLTIALIIYFICRTQVPIYVIAHNHIFPLFFLQLFCRNGENSRFRSGHTAPTYTCGRRVPRHRPLPYQVSNYHYWKKQMWSKIYPHLISQPAEIGRQDMSYQFTMMGREEQ